MLSGSSGWSGRVERQRACDNKTARGSSGERLRLVVEWASRRRQYCVHECDVRESADVVCQKEALFTRAREGTRPATAAASFVPCLPRLKLDFN
jgi:hypothetical protein